MGPFFFWKKEIPAKPKHLTKVNFFKFSLERPPKAIIFLMVKFDNNLNLLIPK